MDCIFCKLKDYVLENELAYAVFDVMPVNPGHLLIIPKRHVQNYFDITPEEELAMHDLLHKGKKLHRREVFARRLQLRRQLQRVRRAVRHARPHAPHPALLRRH